MELTKGSKNEIVIKKLKDLFKSSHTIQTIKKNVSFPNILFNFSKIVQLSKTGDREIIKIE